MLSVIVGAAIVLFTAADEFRTTLGTTGGSGPLSRVIYRSLWIANGRWRCDRWRIVTWVGGTGTMAVVGTIVAWFMMLWLGWTLILLGSHGALISAHSGASASLPSRIFYAGTSLADLGNASYRPAPFIYELCVVAEAFSGLVLITLAITFISPVITGAISRHSFASQLRALGATAAEVTASFDSGGQYGAAQDLMLSLGGQLTQAAQYHRCYPLLITYLARSSETAMAPAVGILLDAAILLGVAVPEERRLPASLLKSVVSSVEAYLPATPTRDAVPAQAPPPPALGEIDGLGWSAADLRYAFDRYASLRIDALHHVLSDGWQWPQSEPAGY
jgi:hypothetical protein